MMTQHRKEREGRGFWRWGALAATLLLLAFQPAARADDMLKVRIAVGGGACLCYLPTMLAEQLGNYKKAGLNVELADFKGGSQAEAAVLGGSSDVVSGFFDHTVVLQPKGKFLQSIVVFDRFPGLVLMVSPGNVDKIKTPADLVGKKVGVSAPGSSTDFFVKYLLRKIGQDPSKTAVVGIGTGATSVAAMEQNQVDAGVLVEPAVTQLLARHPEVRILSDTRSEKDTLAVLGGAYPAGALYTTAEWIEKHPKESQALADAIVMTLQWIKTHTPEEIMAKMPDNLIGPDKALYLAALKATIPQYSTDGMMDPKGAEAVLNVFASSDPEIAKAKVDVSKTYTNKFAEAAGKKLGLTN
ncbi:MAG TPA: ABC transporter substrate-binding protein [Stellaceae bacterium]|nr:ABC transporter substrate-binding protein [Stellaceae bacterium]